MAFEMAEKGVMPHGGGWLQEEHHWVIGIRIVSAQVNAVRAEIIKERQQEQP